MIDSRLSALARLSTVFTSLSVLTVAACGGGAEGVAPKSPATQQTTDESPNADTLSIGSIEDAEKAIALAKTQLAAAGVGLASESGATGTPSSADAPADSSSAPAPEGAPAPVSPAPARPSQQRAPETPSKAALAGDDRCASPCRAIASMRRAVTALCRMTGDDDTRCVEAKVTLTDSEKRIHKCSC